MMNEEKNNMNHVTASLTPNDNDCNDICGRGATTHDGPSQPCQNRPRTIALLIFAMVGAVVGVSVFCGSGHCSSSSSLTASSATSGTTRTVSSAPTPSFQTNSSIDRPSNSTGRNTTTIGTTTEINSTSITVIPTLTPVPPTQSPLAGSHDEKAAIVVSYLNQITLTNRTISLNGSEPEDKALHWMVHKDPILNLSGTNVSFLLDSFTTQATTYQQFRFQQRYSLLTVWFQQDTTIPRWVNASGWAKRFNECTWYGIDCTVIGLGAPLGRQRVVTHIQLMNNNMTGTLSPELGLLSHITKFQLGYNLLFHGRIPSSFGMWTNMSHFSAFYTRLTGSLPETIATNWTSLLHFDVTNNTLIGTIPESIGYSWTKLTAFSINSNLFSGPLPSTIGQFTSLLAFWVSDNSLTGTIPAGIGQWIWVNDADFSFNHFTGTIPASIINWTALEFATFRNNSLSGSLSLGGLCTNGVTTVYTDNEAISCNCCATW